jgi:hypothetical protein
MIKLFISYAVDDQTRTLVPLLKEYLEEILINKNEELDIKYDRTFIEKAGDWEKRIHEELNTCDAYLFLITEKFHASTFIQGIEIPIALKRHEESDKKIPLFYIKLFDCDNVASFKAIQGLREDNFPIFRMKESDYTNTKVNAAEFIDLASLIYIQLGIHFSLKRKSASTNSKVECSRIDRRLPIINFLKATSTSQEKIFVFTVFAKSDDYSDLLSLTFQRHLTKTPVTDWPNARTLSDYHFDKENCLSLFISEISVALFSTEFTFEIEDFMTKCNESEHDGLIVNVVIDQNLLIMDADSAAMLSFILKSFISKQSLLHPNKSLIFLLVIRYENEPNDLSQLDNELNAIKTIPYKHNLGILSEITNADIENWIRDAHIRDNPTEIQEAINQYFMPEKKRLAKVQQQIDKFLSHL